MIADTDRLEFKASPIHGIGGFARVELAAGARVLEYVGECIDKRTSLARCEQGNACLFYLNEEWNLDGNVTWNPARFLNHSCAPNGEAEHIAGRLWIVAKRAIAPGEEITFDYRYDLENYREHPCQCGSPGCLGFIVAGEFREHLRARHRPVASDISG